MARCTAASNSRPSPGARKNCWCTRRSGPRRQLVTEVLARGIRSVGDISPVPEQVTRQMLVGDRQFLLLRLRQATFGDQVRAGLVCPWADCGKRVTIEFALSDVPVVESVDKGPMYSLQLSAEAANGTTAIAASVSGCPPGPTRRRSPGGWR